MSEQKDSLMKWFLLHLSFTKLLDIKFNTVLRFDKLDECQTYLKETEPLLEKGIRRSLPKVRELSFRCIHKEVENCVKKC